MRKLVVTEFMSLDGVMEDPGGAEQFDRGGWVFQFERGPEGDRFKMDELVNSEAMLLGRVTYEGFAAAWPDRTDDTGFADRMNSMPKYVVSSTLENPTWNNATVLRGDAAEEVRKLKHEQGGDILVAGSRQLVQTLAANDLVDEYRLMVIPVILGGGKRMFGDLDAAAALEVVDVSRAGAVVLMVLRPRRG